MKSSRLREMENYILERDTVSMKDLQDKFKTSMNTVRMDVAALTDRGSIRKVYGGVCSNTQSVLVPFEERRLKNLDGKKAAGKKAAALVENGDIIYIDSGTTTMWMVDFLNGSMDVTIITNNLNAINLGVSLPALNIICLSGALERKTNSFISADAAHELRRYNIQKAFMASSGVTESGSVTNSSPLEFEIKKAAIANSGSVYLVIDSDKYGKSALLSYAALSDFDGVITDGFASPGLSAQCARHDTALLIGDLV